MARSSDLMGAGLPAAVANLIGTDYGAVTCTGTNAGTAILLSNDINALTATSGTGAILPALGTNLVPAAGMQIVCSNVTSTAVNATVYPPTGATFNTSASTSITIAQYNTVIFVYASATKIFTIVSA